MHFTFAGCVSLDQVNGSSHTGHNSDEEDACCPQVHTITTSFSELAALSKLLLLSHTEHSGL